MYAALKENEAMIRLLIENNADVNTASDLGTALYLAAKYGHSRIVQLLINNNANLEQTNIIGMTPLYVAV